MERRGREDASAEPRDPRDEASRSEGGQNRLRPLVNACMKGEEMSGHGVLKGSGAGLIRRPPQKEPGAALARPPFPK